MSDTGALAARTGGEREVLLAFLAQHTGHAEILVEQIVAARDAR